VLTLVPKGLMPLVPLFCRSCRKLDKNDCNAVVDWLDGLAALLFAVVLLLPAAAEVLPPKALISVLNAELRFDSTLDERPEVEVLPLSTWLLLRSWTSACNAAMMPPWSYWPATLAGVVVAAGFAAAVLLTGALVEGVAGTVGVVT
jgi:hypothetical protein